MIIPNAATLNYVRQHTHDDVRMLALRGCKDSDVDLPLALQQIQGRQTARRKLPSWADVDGIVYPPHLNMEQCSSELTAKHKALIINQLHLPPKSKFIDLTGGFGVDFAFMADAFDEAVYVERDERLCALATHNFTLLGKRNVTTVCADASAYLDSIGTAPCAALNAQLIYLDPARRDTHGARTYALADCTPNVVDMMPGLLRRAPFVLLKLSPMLDWRKAISDLAPHHVSQVHIVAVDNECKELLLLLESSPVTAEGAAPSDCPPRIVCTDIHPRDGSLTDYSPKPVAPMASVASIAAKAPSTFLYEPNAAVMKAGCFRELAADFTITPLAPNSHLFTSSVSYSAVNAQLMGVAPFPGRTFRIAAVTTMNKRDLRENIGHLRQANIAVRNFPLTAEQLRRRLKLSDGGDDYLFATTLADGTHTLLLCKKEP